MDNGTLDSLKNISTKESSAYQLRHQDAISELVSQIPILSFGSWIPNAKWGLKGIPLLESISDLDIEGDGLLPKRSTILPGTQWVMISGVGHSDPVMSNYFVKFDRVRFTKTLLTMLLKRMEIAK
jgi:hypothetical protein